MKRLHIIISNYKDLKPQVEMDLDQVIELFESKHTADLADRHAQSIQQLCSEMNNELAQDGFFYKELDKVTQVLRLVLNGL